MSTRYVFPELFYAAGAPIIAHGQERLALRWILHPSLGLPRAVFHVWRFEGKPVFRPLHVKLDEIDTRQLISWSEGEAGVAVQLTLSVPAGSVTLCAYSAANGAGHVVDQKTIVGPVGFIIVTLTGSPVASITMTGNAAITNPSIVPIHEFMNDPDWKLVERVGLPASKSSFDASGYPLDPQGPVGEEVDPVSAAIRRVEMGTPDAGWPGTTDRGVSPQSFVPPNPGLLVTKELGPLLKGMAEVLNLVPEPSKQAEHKMEVGTAAPQSVQGNDAPPEWQAKARPAKISPLENLLLAAGVDPFAALALGFGTTIDDSSQPFAIAARATRPKGSGIFMVTVEHKVQMEIKLPIPFKGRIDGELASLYLGKEALAPSLPSGLTASTTSPPRLDPPGSIDERWLHVVEVSWGLPVIATAETSRPSGYAIAKGTPGSPMNIRNEKRLSEGWVSFVPASSPDSESPSSIKYTETGVPEAFLGEPPDLVYSVAAHDWFGRWSNWVSADHQLTSVAPQIPAVRKVEPFIEDGDSSTRDASAAIEFTWDWSHRRPAQIHLRVLVHPKDLEPPNIPGSVLSVEGPTVADRIIDFSTATADIPPVGVAAISEEALGNLRTYRVEVNGIALNFGSHLRMKITSRARATERVVPARHSAWSRDVSADVASPIPPPEPFVPAAMWWASIPDPRGVARTTLEWTDTAPLYAIYLADETALLRELAQPSADLEKPAADRLEALRALDIGHARRAFRRIADRVPTNSLEVELSRGSRLIHFYGVVPISDTGVEGSLPAAANNYFAVATPIVKTPEGPTLLARDRDSRIGLSVEVPETRVQAARIEIFRAPSRHRAVSVEMSGPPILVVDASLGERSGGSIRWELEDTAPGTVWQSVFYRAVAYGATDLSRGEYGGRSVPSRAIEVVPSSPFLPPLTDLKVDDLDAHPNHRLVSFVSEVTLARTPLGMHTFVVQTIAHDTSVATRRVGADTLPLITPDLRLPSEDPANKPDLIFRFDPVNPRKGRIYLWVPRDIRVVVVEVMDPAGQTTRLTQEVE